MLWKWPLWQCKVIFSICTRFSQLRIQCEEHFTIYSFVGEMPYYYCSRGGLHNLQNARLSDKRVKLVTEIFFQLLGIYKTHPTQSCTFNTMSNLSMCTPKSQVLHKPCLLNLTKEKDQNKLNKRARTLNLLIHIHCYILFLDFNVISLRNSTNSRLTCYSLDVQVFLSST